MPEATSKTVVTVLKVAEPVCDNPIQYFSRVHWEHARRHAHSIVHNSADAEDAAQESYVKLFQTFVTGHRVDSCMAWIKGVIHRVIVDQYRKARPDLHLSTDSVPAETAKTEDKPRNSLPELADDSVSVEERLVHENLVQQSLRILAELPELDRECVLMYARGYKFVQIASALGISYEAAIATTRKALAKTRRTLEKTGHWKRESKQRAANSIPSAGKVDVGRERVSLVKPVANDFAGIRALSQVGDLYSFGDVVVNLTNRCLSRCDNTLRMPSKEFKLLVYFVTHADETLTRAQLLQEVWGYRHSATIRTLDTHVARLRQKVEANPSQPKFIVTARGIGYRFLPCGNPSIQNT